MGDATITQDAAVLRQLSLTTAEMKRQFEVEDEGGEPAEAQQQRHFGSMLKVVGLFFVGISAFFILWALAPLRWAFLLAGGPTIVGAVWIWKEDRKAAAKAKRAAVRLARQGSGSMAVGLTREVS